MNERDRLIDDILNEVSANRGQTSPRRTPIQRQSADDLIADILAEKTSKVEDKPYATANVANEGGFVVRKVKAEEKPIAPQPKAEEKPIAPKPKNKKKPIVSPTKKSEEKSKLYESEQEKEKPKSESDEFLAGITPWQDRHQAGRRGLSKEETVDTVNSGSAPKAESVKTSQTFLQNLKRSASIGKKKDTGKEVLYKKAGSSPVVEPPPIAPATTPSELYDVHTDEWQAAVSEATRSIETTYEPTRMMDAPSESGIATTQATTVTFETNLKGGTKEITGQVRLEGFDSPEQPPSPQQWENDFANDRKDKIKKFKMEADSLPKGTDSPLTHEDDGDYHTFADAAPIKYDLLARQHNISLQMMITVILGVFVLMLTLVGTIDFTNGLLTENPRYLLGLYLILLIASIACNVRLLWGGFTSLFKGCDQDSPAAIAVSLALIQGAAMFVFSDCLSGSFAASLVGAPALFSVFLNLWGKRLMFSRLYRNMDLIGNDREKQGVVTVQGKDESFELGRGLSVGTPKVVFARSCVNVKDFIYHSYAPDMAEHSGRLPTLLSPAFGAMGALFVALFVPSDSILQAVLQIVSGFCGGVCIGLPVALTVAGNLPMYRFCRRLLGDKVMFSGYDAVEEFKDTEILALDAAQLFPSGSVTLKSLKSASNQSLDRSILDVAGVVYMAECPLKPLFQEILQEKTSFLPQVDTLVYEEEMGLSGWVSGYRVLVGTRKLMEHHGVPIPDTDYEEQYSEQGLSAVYLSTQGILSAVFLVKYSPDPKVAEAVKQAIDAGKKLQIYSCDPNITAEMICRMFRIPSGTVRVMGAVSRRLYKQQIDQQTTIEGVLTYEGNAAGLCRGVASATKLHNVIRLATILQILLLVVGVLLFCVCTYLLGGMSGGLVLLYQLMATILIVVLPMLMGR